MFLTIGLILLVLWALGAFIVPVGGGLIHILLVIALISVVWHLVTGRRAV
ncbi:MAG TPA: lmo0937 family membrane protein [Gemmatimonadaceae bacterium]|nr:lmo0937 family membrane protein [Gemmatimonadaceae bacterium]